MTQDKYTTREIEKGKNQTVFCGAISISIVISLLIGFCLYGMLPHRICHTEEKTIKYTSEEDTRKYSYDTQIVCEEGIFIGEYKFLNEKIIFSCMSLNATGDCAGRGKICMITTKEEICEIK